MTMPMFTQLIGIFAGVASSIATVWALNTYTGKRWPIAYATLLMLIAAVYVFFAWRVGLSAPTTLAVVSLIGFSFIAGLGVGQSHWWLVVGLLLHGLLDLAYHEFLQYPGVPHWYPLPCMAYDWSMAAAVAWRIWSDDRNIIPA